MINFRKENEDAAEYPSGLILILTDETLKKAGIDELPALGTAFTIYGKAEVISISQKEEGREMALQITDLELTGEKASTSQVLYGGGLKGNINYVEGF